MIVVRPKSWSIKPPPGAQISLAHPLAHGLIGAWLFNEGGGDRARNLGSLGAPYDATRNTGGNGWVSGPAGPALSLSNTTRNWAAPSLPAMSQVTLVCRYQTSNGALGQILTRDTTGPNRVWQFRNDPGPLRVIFFNTGGSNGQATTSSSINDGKYHLLAATWDGSTIQCYVDGKADGSPVSFSGSLATSSVAGVFFCGNSFNAGNGDIGTFDFAYIYNRALSAAEIAALYAAPFQMVAAPRRRVARIPLNNYTLTGDPGLLALAGQDAGLYHDRRIIGDAGGLALAGEAAELTVSQALFTRRFVALGSLIAVGARRRSAAEASAAVVGEASSEPAHGAAVTTGVVVEGSPAASVTVAGFERGEAEGSLSAAGRRVDGAADGAGAVRGGEGALAIVDGMSETIAEARGE